MSKDKKQPETDIGSEPALKPDTSNAMDIAMDKTAPKEIGGPKGLEPTRYGDWESKGRCYDF